MLLKYVEGIDGDVFYWLNLTKPFPVVQMGLK